MPDGAYRVSYAEGRRVRAADLAAEQEYLLALDRRHNLALHGTGIVLGLDRVEDESRLRAGAAVVADGRVLVLEEETRITAGGGQCVDVWLIRCDTCVRGRVHEHVRVHTVPVSSGAEELPPVEGAFYLGRYLCDDLRELAYTSLVASAVNDPGGRAVMQVGPATGRDRNAFVISTADASGKLKPRISLDRMGANRIDGTLTVSGYRAWAQMPLTDTLTLVVVARQPGMAGERIHVRARPEGDVVPKLRLQFFDGLRKSSAPDLVLTKNDIGDLVKKYESELVVMGVTTKQPRRDRPLILGGLARVGLGNRIGIGEAEGIGLFALLPNQQPREQADPFRTSADVSLRTRGGGMKFFAQPATTFNDGGNDEESLGCLERIPNDPARVQANGLSFVAMKEAPHATPQPGAWSVRTGTAEEPREELRLDLGAKKENDKTIRFSAGKPEDDDVFTQGITISGKCLVTMPALVVTGSVQPGPIKADPTDPDFRAGMVRAWLEGLQAAIQASTVVDLTFVGLPAPFLWTGEPFDYSVTINNRSGRELTVDKVLETLTVGSKVITNTPGQQVAIPAGQQANIPIHHDPRTIPAGLLSIEIRVSGSIGRGPWWKARTTDTAIEVRPSPTINVDGIPASVPKMTPWTQRFDVENNAAGSLHVDRVTLRENAQPPVDQAGLPADIPGGSSMPFGPNPHAGINPPDLALTIAAEVEQAARPLTVTVQHTIRVRDDLTLQINVTTAPVAGQPWTYDLTLTNTGGQRLTLQSLGQRIAPNAAFQPIAIPPGTELLNPADVLPLPVNGIVAQAAGNIVLEIAIVYGRDDGFTFQFQPPGKGITAS